MALLSDLVGETMNHENDQSDDAMSDSGPGHTEHKIQAGGSSQRVTHFVSPPTTPSMRTGPPRTLSYVYPGGSPANSRSNSKQIPETDHADEGEEFPFSTTDSVFRGALEVGTPSSDRKGKRRESRLIDDSWNPIKWFQESPKDEKPDFEFPPSNTPQKLETDNESIEAGPQSAYPGGPEDPASSPQVGLRRAFSVPHEKEKGKQAGRVKWKRLRSLIPNVVNQAKTNAPGPSAVAPPSVNITDELITGGLSTLMLRLWFERDEKDQRRIPVLLHRLRIRISDSLHPLHTSKAVFRIECEYANGAARWVIYRQLRDFLSLHAHYAVSNAYNRNIEDLPEFPRTSLPYFKFLKKEGREKGNEQVGQAEFARLQREALESYLLDLIRTVMFHPTSNRLAGFLEISALSISLAQSGGTQYKAGYLHIEAIDGKSFGRKSSSWKDRKSYKWCALRESYLVAQDEPGETVIWDVFLMDPEFGIEQPKRYYRQGLNLLHSDAHDEKAGEKIVDETTLGHGHGSTLRLMGSIKGRVSRIFHPHRRSQSVNGTTAHDTEESSSDSSSDSSASRPPTPLLDPSTNQNPLSGAKDNDDVGDQPWDGEKKSKRQDPNQVSKHTFFVYNSQMRLKLYARNERQMHQWITAFQRVAGSSHFTGRNRFDSFSPIRLNVAAQWLVDGRDYFWNLSRAILLARETIYIHDWWLSPELQLRRPNKERYRLDRLLQRKAREGVKIYVILYQEVSSRTTPTDSNYAKQRLTALHDNIMVQRSPSHFQTGTFFWAHHEKLCVIDQAIAFMGGLDACFGRWDTPRHILVDDIDESSAQSEIWPGKDYSNPRISDFHTLNKPEEDMYDRSKVPRMPWHDVSMQVVGQPARDLARHFVQRWNHLLRIKNHSRVMPFLLPPPEFKPGELTQMGLTGTCEMQICRSAGPWSIGTPARIEHSIQNAYLKAIQMSEHFVYIENQFFITSTVVNEVKIENKIGDALVHRIIQAHREGIRWRCCIVIPLLPGFTFPVDHSDASAIRIILECQNRTIARGPNSIFARLRKEGIDPDDYISVFSLRNWAKLRGDVLTTEQVYIHAKVCIVDDRLAIIGSANINERSQRGDRDSEIAAVIRDTDMIDCTMAGKPFQVGRFAHSLRVRLMREHLGVDVDALYEADLMANDPVKREFEQEPWDPDTEQEHGTDGVTKIKKSNQRTAAGTLLRTTADGMKQAFHAAGDTTSGTAGTALQSMGVVSSSVPGKVADEALEEERTTFSRDGKQEPGFAGSMVPTLEEKTIAENTAKPEANGDAPKPDGNATPDSDAPEPVKNGEPSSSTAEVQKADADEPQEKTSDGELFGAPADASTSAKTDDRPPHARSGVDDADEEERAAPPARASIRKNMAAKPGTSNWKLLVPGPEIDPDGFEDPVCDEFWKKVWVASAVHNTEIYRKVFHAIPDDLVTTWKQYREFVAHHERLNKPPKDSTVPEAVARVPSEAGDEGAPGQEAPVAENVMPSEEKESTEGAKPDTIGRSSSTEKDPKSRKPAKGTEPFEKWERDEMEKLLGELRGHLVLYSNRFLEGEDVANNFLFNADRLLPLPIYD
ncbi:phospholipase D [Mycena floridula]|nr:phospholipase D [Mycena floridula]